MRKITILHSNKGGSNLFIFIAHSHIIFKMVKRVSDSYKNNIFYITIGPLIKIFEAFFDLLIPLFMKAIIDLSQYQDVELISNKLTYWLAKFIRLFPSINQNQALSDALVGGIIIFLMGIVGFFVTMIAQYIAAKTAVKVGTEVRDSLFDKILHLSKRQIDDIGISRLITSLNSDTYQVQQGVLIYIRLIARAPFILIGALVISYILDWRIGLAFTAIVPLLLLIIFIVLHKAEKNYVGIQKDLDDLSLKSADTIEGSRVIRAFEKEKSENNEFIKKSEKYQKSAIRVNKINALINPLAFAVTSIVLIIIMFLIKDNLINGSEAYKTVIASTLIAEMSYLSQIFFTVVQLTGVLLDITKAGVSRKRIDEILSVDNEIVSGLENVKNDNEEIIKYDHVYFSYDKKEKNYTLKDIDFVIKKGETIGIIGGTGSGKSTIVNLLERFYDVSKGNIYYQGQNIKDLNLEIYRQELAFVNQKASLFQGTIRDLFLMAKIETSDLEIIDALKKAQAYDFVLEKGGLETQIEENGVNFSGGQRQRLSIARALIRNSKVLILDDSTSALDLLTDKKIRNELAKLKDVTKIIISQRVASINDADKILVIDKGEIVERGNHQYLMKHSSIYKEIYETQIRKDEHE